ncbi:MAG: PilN domain-containing protein [Planctomycetes bacterium]|nr:PilN domain-containing protein [Planctomycetota bacterium]
MVNIDFVPNDYIQERESSKANFLCLVLFAALMGAIGVTFSIIKMKQKVVRSELAAVNARMTQAAQQISQLEELKTKGKAMMKTMVLTAELLEPIPKSVILACLTNNLPGGASLLELKLTQEERKVAVTAPSGTSQYSKAGAKPSVAAAPTAKVFDTFLEIGGIAPSDIEVAAYIASLSRSILLDNVALVESKEHTIEETKFRQFKLEASLKQEVQLSSDDLLKIREKHDGTS